MSNPAINQQEFDKLPEREKQVIRNYELRNILERRDSYEIVVRFTRSFDDDLGCGGDAIQDGTKPVGQALLDQFITELQAAYDETGMAGHFEVE